MSEATSFTSVPVVDITNLSSPDPAERKLVAVEIGKAAREVGFFYIRGAAIDEALFTDLLAATKEFFALPIEARNFFGIVWEIDGRAAGWSSADKIVFGQEAYMHLHVLDPERRGQGNGTFFVRESAKIYFDTLRIKRLFCEPYAFNVAPNRTLQAAGFKYVKTHETVPGPFNFHQPVTRWMLEKH